MRIKKFLSAKCPVWSGICLSCGRCHRLYCCVVTDGGGAGRGLIVVDSCKQPLIAFPHQLNKVWQIWRAVSTSLAAAKECFDALVVCAGDKSNPRWRCVKCVCQPRHNDRPENHLQTNFTEAMMPQHSQCVQRLMPMPLFHHLTTDNYWVPRQ